MSLAMIIALPLLTALGLLYWAEQSEDYILKLAFRLAYIPLVWLSVHLAVVDATIIYSANTELINTLVELVTYTEILFVIVGLYLLYQLIMAVKDYLTNKKESKQEEMYG